MSQNLFFQDTFNGGIAGGSYNSWLTSSPYTLELNIDEQSSIRRAFLFVGVYGEPLSTSMSLNNNEIILSEDLFSSGTFTTQGSGNEAYYLRTVVTDITEFINSSQIIISPPTNQPPFNQGRYVQFYILILYENSSLPETSVSVFLSEQNCSGIMNYVMNGLNAINTNHPVGLAINGAQMCNIDFDGSEVFVNDIHIGLIGGDDISSPYGCGVSGAFYYEQNLFYGLGDDVANNTVDAADAIADIQPYINGNSSVDVSFVYQSLNNPPHPNAPFSNVIWQMYLVYTSNCESFEISVLTSDTTTCTNSPVQLGVTVPDTINATYEWIPQTNLSCYDCPNPVFLGDSTINYTVRIWASDSCSKVLPVRVRVVPSIELESVFATPSLCGIDDGTLLATAYSDALPISYQINGGEPQESGLFTNVAAGIYTVTATNAVGCTSSLQGVVNELNNIQAAFSVNPSSGAAPLTVQTQNNSQNATEYEWFWENQMSTLQNPSITLDTAGIYTIMLVASNGAEHCNDTATAIIFVEEPFVVFAYSYVTDEADVYQIFLSGVSEYDYLIYALDGKLVYQKNGNIEAAGYVDLWEISGVSSGMYVFRVRVMDNAGSEHEIEGKVVVVR